MPEPLKAGEDVYIDYKELPGDYAMPTMQAAKGWYTIGYNLGGDRKYFTHTKIYYARGETIGFALPDIYHRNMPVSGEPYKRFVIKYKKEAVQSVIDLIGEKEFIGMHMEYMKFSKESLEIIRPQFENMLAVYNSRSKYSQFMLKNMLQNLILTIYQRRLPPEDDGIQLASFNEQVYEAMMYIDRNLTENLSLEEVAKKVALSPSYFSRLFKSSVGCAFSEYVTYTRIQYAKILMANEKLSVGEIALRCGFNNSNYFSTMFKKFSGVTPKEYRSMEYVK